MAEKIVKENIEPALKDLDGRIARLEKSLKIDVDKVETYTREEPMRAIGITFLAGIILGVLLGKSRSKD
ncbi:MAG: hypothetical protein QG670_747 [Thermoproteota archaeon]|nr:hypothetical protein [Thermoproteota archaeon]